MRRAACSWPTRAWQPPASSMARTIRKPGDAAPRTPTATRSSLPGSASRTVPTRPANTVIRGGYGIFYDSAELREIDGAAGVYPYVSRGNYTQTLNQTAPLQTTDQLFPSFTSGGVATPAVNGFLAVNQSPEPRNPYVQQWSLGIQRQFKQSTTAELNYVGSHGDNLLMRINIAQALQYTPDNPTVAGRRPYPNFATIYRQRLEWLFGLPRPERHAHASWPRVAGVGRLHLCEEHRQQVRRCGHRSERVRRLAGVPEQPRRGARPRPLVVRRGAPRGGELRLEPALRQGRAVRDDASGLTQALIGGWQVNGIYLWQGGFPISVFAADVGGVLDSFGTNRADIVGDIHSGGGTVEQWFNTAAFKQPALGSFGNSGRSILRGPGQNRLDLSLFKNFSLPKNATRAAPGGGLQRLQPSEFRGRVAEPHRRELRGDHIRPRRPHRPAGGEAALVTDLP